MNPILLDKCETYLVAQSARVHDKKLPVRTVTLSRETGAGALAVSRLVMENLETAQKEEEGHRPWSVFDSDLIKKALQEHQLPETLEQYLPEDAIGTLDDLSENLFGLHPLSDTLVEHTNRTILRLAETGNAILVGRGANLITRHLQHALHVRLIAPLEFRIRHVAASRGLDEKAAADFVQKGDRAKARYIRKYFEAAWNDPLQFHLTINTGLVDFPDAARLITGVVLKLKL